MQEDHNEFMRVKFWLFRYQAPIWGGEWPSVFY